MPHRMLLRSGSPAAPGRPFGATGRCGRVRERWECPYPSASAGPGQEGLPVNMVRSESLGTRYDTPVAAQWTVSAVKIGSPHRRTNAPPAARSPVGYPRDRRRRRQWRREADRAHRGQNYWQAFPDRDEADVGRMVRCGADCRGNRPTYMKSRTGYVMMTNRVGMATPPQTRHSTH